MVASTGSVCASSICIITGPGKLVGCSQTANPSTEYDNLFVFPNVFGQLERPAQASGILISPKAVMVSDYAAGFADLD